MYGMPFCQHKVVCRQCRSDHVVIQYYYKMITLLHHSLDVLNTSDSFVCCHRMHLSSNKNIAHGVMINKGWIRSIKNEQANMYSVVMSS